jgi:hypothetical protein
MDELLPALLPFVELLGELIKAVMPLLKPAVEIVVGALRILIDILKAIVEGIQTVMRFIQDLIARFQSAASTISSIDLNPFAASGGSGTAEMAGYSRSGRSGRSGVPSTSGNLTVHVYGGDPWRIEQGVRRGYRGWTGGAGSGAPGREY